MRRKNMRVLLVLSLLLVITGGLPSAMDAVYADGREKSVSMASTEAFGWNSVDHTDFNGVFVVQVLKDGHWQEAGRLGFGTFLKQQQIDMGSFLTSTDLFHVRIQKEGGAAAYIDSVFLDNFAPIKVNGQEGMPLMKISKTDLDLFHVENEIELIFDIIDGKVILSITGKIEGEGDGEQPFVFPVENAMNPMGKPSEFYTYHLDTEKGSLALDGSLHEVELLDPFFEEYCVPTAGHSSGYTYGWVMNDGENLYIAVDFTSDHTKDDLTDYMKVYIHTSDRIKEYKISAGERNWGRSDFVYTDKVSYQHRIYACKIPLQEIMDDQEQNELKLAFFIYGADGRAPY